MPALADEKDRDRRIRCHSTFVVWTSGFTRRLDWYQSARLNQLSFPKTRLSPSFPQARARGWGGVSHRHTRPT